MSSRFADGATLGRYRLLRRIGAGAMGEVYLAEDPHIERRLAIKTLLVSSGESMQESELRARLMREAKAAGRLSHPNVVTLFDVGESQGVLYLAFEYVSGSDLDSRMKREPPLSLGEVLRIGRQAAEGLAAAHREGIVHRDIKPSNLMLDAAGQVKISDFGIAKVVGQETELTMTGSVVGSPHYLSPEQVRGEELDGRSDLFSLGVVLFQLLTGKRPFEAETLTTLVYQILEREAPELSLHRPGLPPRLESLISRLLVKDRNKRCASADEVVAELRTLEGELPERVLATTAALNEDLQATRHLTGNIASSPATPPPPPLPTPATVPAARRAVPIPLLVTLAVLALVVLGGLGLWWMGRPGDGGTVAVASAPPLTAAEQASDASGSAPTPTPSPVDSAPGDEPAAARVESERFEPIASGDGPDPQPLPTSEPPMVAAATPTARPRATPTPLSGLPTPRPTPRPSRERTLPGPSPSVDQPAASATPRPTPTPEPDPWDGVDIDRELTTGLALAFRVEPDDAVVQLMSPGDRRFTHLGKAVDWNPAEKGGRRFELPGAGEYLVRLRSPGRVDQVLHLDASGGNRETTIVVQLRRQNAADVERGDLEQVVVRESIAFRIEPDEAQAVAEVWVDERRMGAAGQYSGGMRIERWLRLTTGSHRVSVRAAGFRRRDLLVEVRADADERRERISLRLVVER